eukprot:scaffold168019_cov25-Tisochrysis_lutea.AAC.1
MCTPTLLLPFSHQLVSIRPADGAAPRPAAARAWRCILRRSVGDALGGARAPIDASTTPQDGGGGAPGGGRLEMATPWNPQADCCILLNRSVGEASGGGRAPMEQPRAVGGGGAPGGGRLDMATFRGCDIDHGVTCTRLGALAEALSPKQLPLELTISPQSESSSIVRADSMLSFASFSNRPTARSPVVRSAADEFEETSNDFTAPISGV